MDLDGISWVIVGGESGPGARSMRAAWVRNIHEQCQHAKIPFFFKQWGGIRKHETGRELDGSTYSELPILANAT
jgi:protein gp37